MKENFHYLRSRAIMLGTGQTSDHPSSSFPFHGLRTYFDYTHLRAEKWDLNDAKEGAGLRVFLG